ncbi:MAG: bifunctional demethylmenaquinone methyltransferase/2-methoxy-6-polyprenyl-1,4-benzoquinol methylase UbiE [Bacteroidales bacterium]|nr:bifunctional demethylmenaquinone methyltransferase/2-methoxy-6-polyprenyl-1,4-benzoquinol methylase UbiE [Bacteroidales bacterium]
MPRKENIEQMFDAVAPTYDSLNHIMSLGVDKSWRRKAVREIVGGGAKEVLDVACGTGDSTIAIARALPEDGIVTGIDISDGMMALVAGKAAKKGVAGKITLRKEDGEAMSFADSSFDCVTCSFGIRNFEHKEKGLAEFRRVLRPGGKLVILELSVPQNKVLRRLYDIYFLHILPWIGGLISGEKAAYRYLPASVHNFPAPDAFAIMLSEAGFSSVRYRTLSLGLCRLYICKK